MSSSGSECGTQLVERRSGEWSAGGFESAGEFESTGGRVVDSDEWVNIYPGLSHFVQVKISGRVDSDEGRCGKRETWTRYPHPNE